MINWERILSVLGYSYVRDFVDKKVSGEALYESAISKGVGPLVRPVIRRGVDRSRRAAREALRRRGVLCQK
jgi:hypothetical protein